MNLFLENSFTVGTFKLFFPKTKSACFQIGPQMAKSIHFIKAGFNTEISQISGFQNHLQTKTNLNTSISQFQKTHFAMTNPVGMKI